LLYICVDKTKIRIRFFMIRFKTNRMTKFRICLVENNLKYGHFLRRTFSQNTDFDLEIFTCGKDCLEALDSNPDLICIDFALSDMSCDELLSHIYNRNLSVLVFKVQNDTNVALELLKLGSADYILANEYLPDLHIDYVGENFTDICPKNEVEFVEESELSTLSADLNKADSKIVRELKAIVELAGILSNGNKLNITGFNSLHPVSVNFIVPSEKTLREYTTDIIVYYLRKYNQNVVRVAEKLDIGKSTIYNMIKSGEITLNK